MTLARLSERLRTGELSPREAVQGYLDRIERLDPQVNAYISVRPEAALAEAENLEASDRRPPLYGVPIALKDLFDVAGMPTTAGSRILVDNVATEDAVVVKRLKAAGSIILGKLNTHEFAYGTLTDSPVSGRTHNPWSFDRSCGGSSGGSGAAAAADLAAGTLGTDTAGSVRMPAAFCGVTGLRTTTGLVPTKGVISLSYSFDSVGPIASSAEDCELLLGAIAGFDPEDPTTVPSPSAKHPATAEGGLKGLTIGMVDALFEACDDPAVASAAEDAVQILARLGARIEHVHIPWLEQAGVISQGIQFVEATEVNLKWLRTRLYDIGSDVRSRLMAGLFVPATSYIAAQRARRIFYNECCSVFKDCQLLVAPTVPCTAPLFDDPAGEQEPDAKALAANRFRFGLLRYNTPWSLIGSPVLALPCGFADGLPVSLAMVAPRFQESLLLQAGKAFQMATDWHLRQPTALSSLE